MSAASYVTPAVGQLITQHSSSGSTQVTNYARIGHAAQQLLPEILQDLISIREPTTLLHSHVTNNSFLSRTLKQHEWSVISNVNLNGYANFDVPLIYKLVRNLNLVPKPKQGWDYKNPPQQSEITPGDDIECIRRVRNEIFHRGNSSVSATELALYFNVFRDIAGRLEIYLGKPGGNFVNKFNLLENCCMDEETEEIYLKRLDDLKRREKDVSEKVHNVEEEISVIKDSVRDTKTKVQMRNQIEIWKAKDEKFVSTRAVDYVIKTIQKKSCITLTG
ncbi:unnamed protein product [Mytilus coruscus]|uniref:DZIP3-like HEPN domain-containing protein n=1 Tax=Mytilus coruscus TaxID=42192 RepID=A0A6J7ZV76_MYTCO|nr:unnamed protein product [Mytilus coruscus]